MWRARFRNVIATMHYSLRTRRWKSPKIALSVLVENGGHGGATAAPIARLVMDYYLLGKLPEEAAAKAVEQNDEEGAA